ncbi:MAG: alpha/beta fold hydrolase [Deltaproteobacteria bacterium]|nr:alpha/beta fold hydrolase [Deltaproteobacteria bacterium]MDQ3295158.1 alpha/beta fold hydrolase [Myxococcota bacterium]
MYVRDVGMGMGPVVLLLHGTPSPAEDWLPLVEVLARRYRVLVPDLPGYGQSSPLADPRVELEVVADRGHALLIEDASATIAAVCERIAAQGAQP